MHIKNSDFTGYSGGVGHIGLRQICDLTNLKGCKFGSLSYRSEIALCFATFSYAHRYRQAKKTAIAEKSHFIRKIICGEKVLYLQ
jgi:hypothetical protein